MTGDRRPPSLPERHELVKYLASGGMADIYIVRHVDLRSYRALKVIGASLARDPSFQARFREEQVLAARLGVGHRHIIRVFDAGRLPTGEPYALMEYFRRGSLAGQGGAPGSRTGHAAACGILRDIASALRHLSEHPRGPYVHRDLKPHNILVDDQDGIPFGVLADFGLARAVDATGVAEQAFTPAYAAPEQWRSETLTPATDVYALGITVCEVLTGERPLAGQSNEEWREAHLHGAPDVPDPSDGRLLPIAQLMRRSLAKEPRHRPRAEDWERALGQATWALGGARRS